jgi:serine protease Do
VIYSIDGTVVYSPNGLQNLVAQRSPGDRVSVRIYRDGSPREMTIRLGEADLAAAPVVAEATPEPPAAEEKLGIAFGPLTEELADTFGYSDPGGVVITNVIPLSPASRRGIGRGFRILEINGNTISESGDVNRSLRDVDAGDIVTLRLGLPSGASQVVNVRAGG